MWARGVVPRELTVHMRYGAEGALPVQEGLEGVRVRVHDQADDDHVVAGRDELVGAADEPLALAREPGAPWSMYQATSANLSVPLRANVVASAC